VVQRIKFVNTEGFIFLTPPYFVLARFFPDYELVIRRSTGVMPGPYYDWTKMSYQSFPAPHDLLVKGWSR